MTGAPISHANEHDLFVVERKKNSKKKARRSFPIFQT